MTGALGVSALDARLGHLPAGASVLLRCDAAVEALPVLLQVCHTQLDAGRDVVFVALQRPPGAVRRALRSLGFEAPGNGKLTFVDAYSALVGSRDESAVHVSRPRDPEAVLDAVDGTLGAAAAPVLLVDAVDALGGPDASAATARLRRIWTKTAFACGAAMEWNLEGKQGKAVRGAFDAEVRLRAVEDRIVLNQFMEVVRTPWAQEARPPVLYRVSHPGGVLAHVPKLVVVGPHDAGKTTFVHAVAGDAVSVERMGTTVAMDRATAQVGFTTVEVFGTPGQVRFDALLGMLSQSATAAILVVDATRPETFGRAADILRLVWRQGLTAVVALNKQDLEGAVSPEKAAGHMDLPQGVRIVGCSARDPASARDVLKTVLEDVLGVSP